MPASAVMTLFKQGKLHSGKDGPVVKKASQAKAILLSLLRKEGRPVDDPHAAD